MSFFVMPYTFTVVGHFKIVPFDKLMVLSKVEGQMYGALEDKDMAPFGLELRAERLCTILKRPIIMNL